MSTVLDVAVRALSDATADEISRWCAVAAAISGAVALAWRILGGMFRTIHRMGILADDLLGDDVHPSLSSRIDQLARDLAETRGTVARTEETLTSHIGTPGAHARAPRR